MDIHLHKPNWHRIALGLEQLIHDPRFWAAVALCVLLALMVISLRYAPVHNPMMGPIYPGLP